QWPARAGGGGPGGQGDHVLLSQVGAPGRRAGCAARLRRAVRRGGRAAARRRRPGIARAGRRGCADRPDRAPAGPPGAPVGGRAPAVGGRAPGRGPGDRGRGGRGAGPGGVRGRLRRGGGAGVYPQRARRGHPGSPGAAGGGENRAMTRSARELNEVIRYTMWSVFRVAQPPLEDDRSELAAEVSELFDQLSAKDGGVRGTYDAQGPRADADFMVWWHAPSPDELQDAYARLRRTRLGRGCEPVWSVLALHRPAEFNKSHVPAFLADEQPRRYVSVYPFVRSYEWYLLPETERRRMLAEHGRMAREYPDVRSNTVASFSLGDYEWILAFEA